MTVSEYIRSVIVLGLVLGQPVLWAWICWLEWPIDTAGAFGLCIAVGVLATLSSAWLRSGDVMQASNSNS